MNAAATTIPPAPPLSQWYPGFHANVPAELYHRRELGVVNKGALDQLAKTPSHYRAWVDGAEQEETAALAFGKALHCAILEPDEFARAYVVAKNHPYNRPSERQRKAAKPSQGTLDAIAYFDAWEQELAGRIELDEDQYKVITGMQASVHAHPMAGNLLQGGKSEVTAVWNDPRTGLRCKARFDYRRDDLGITADVKTTEDASPAGFARSIARYRYHVQESHYTAGVEALLLEQERFLFIAVEKKPPHAVGVYMLDTESALLGDDLRARDMDTLVDCLKTDTWPGYSAEVNTLALPNWAFSD